MRVEAAHDRSAFAQAQEGVTINSMLQALRPEDALAIAEISRRRSRDEQAMAQYLGIGRRAHAVRRQGFRDNGLDKLREVLAHRVGDVMRPAAGAASGGY